MDTLAASETCTIYYNNALHTKLYIADCDGFRAAILGSPNFTPAGEHRNIELAVEVRTTMSTKSDDIAALTYDLMEHAYSILSSPETFLK